jgi:hypothetical protein
MKLYAFKPDGYGQYSFFTIAKTEEEAIEAVNKHIDTHYRKDGPLEYEAWDWGTDYYKMTVLEEGEVVENDNQ